MKSPSTLIHNNGGLTLVEILVVLGIFAVIISIGASFSLGSYQAYLFNTEYGNISKLLAKARNEAANNFDESAHGVHIDSDAYTFFTGDTYVDGNPNNIPFARNAVVVINGNTDVEVVFDQLSGNLKSCDVTPSGTCEINFQYGNRSKTININNVGGITW